MKEGKIDKLAGMVQKGFESLENRLGQKIDSLRSDMEKGFNEVNSRLDKTVMPELDDHAHRIKKLEEVVRPHS